MKCGIIVVFFSLVSVTTVFGDESLPDGAMRRLGIIPMNHDGKYTKGLVYASGGKKLLSYSSGVGAKIICWDLSTKKALWTVILPEVSYLKSVTVSHDGNTAAALANINTVIFIDMKTGQQKHTITRRANWFSFLAGDQHGVVRARKVLVDDHPEKEGC